jgi:predicted nucleotidyltransferase
MIAEESHGAASSADRELKPMLDAMTERLQAVDGVVAVALGGSRARGRADSGSDVDLGLYYRRRLPPAVDQLRAVAAELDDNHPEAAATELGAWGPWIDGGAWLVVGGRRVDWIYREVERVESFVDACLRGEVTSAWQPGHPLGFHSHIYAGEVHCALPLADGEGVLAALKARTATYPPRLRRALQRDFLWQAAFALEVAAAGSARCDVLHVVASLTQCAGALVQVLLALNERYYVGEKRALDEVATLALVPSGFAAAVRDVLAEPGRAPAALAEGVRRMEALMSEVKALAAAKR